MKIWDRPTRLFHWLLAFCIVVSFVSVRMNEMGIHFLSGGTILALIIFRVVWGLIGSDTARFTQFLPTPSRIRAWRAGGQIGHSPWGALSVFALLGVIGAQATLGLFTDDDIFLTGPLRDYVSYETALRATALHGLGAKIIFTLVLLHLAAILFYTVIKKSDLLKVFLTGHRTGGTMETRSKPMIWSMSAAAMAALIVVVIFQAS